MKKRNIFFLVLLLLAGTFVPHLAIAQSALELDTAISNVADKIKETLPNGAVVAVKRFAAPSEALSKHISDQMDAALKGNGFTMAVRDAETTKLLDEELDYQYSSGNVSDNALVEIGKQIGAQYLVSGYFEQLGSYLGLYVRVVDVKTKEAPVIENNTISASSRLNQLLGSAREKQSAQDYLEEIARCRIKMESIKSTRDSEIEKETNKLQAKYQADIAEIKQREKPDWLKTSVFEEKKAADIAAKESARDTEIAGTIERITIQYNSTIKGVELSEHNLKEELQKKQFKLSGPNQVQVHIGAFDAEADEPYWPVSVKSLDEEVPYRIDNAKLKINTADLESEYNATVAAKTNGYIAGEITYSVVAHTNDDKFDVVVIGYRVYNTQTGASYLNPTVNTKVEGARSATIKQAKITPASVNTNSKKKLNSTTTTASTASVSNSANSASTTKAPWESQARSSPANARVSDTFGVSYFFLSDSTHYTLHGAALNVLSSNFGHFYIDWLNAAIGAGSEALFVDATIDVGAWLHLFAPVFAFVKGGIGAYYLDYTLDDDNSYDDWKDNDFEEAYSTVGAVAKIGAGLEVKLSERIKLAASYDLHFLLGAQAVAADSFRVGICFGSPVRQ